MPDLYTFIANKFKIEEMHFLKQKQKLKLKSAKLGMQYFNLYLVVMN